MSQIGVVNSTCTRGTVNITIDDTPLAIPNGDHAVFSAFGAYYASSQISFRADSQYLPARNLTNGASLPFELQGNARVVANTSIGQLTLDPVTFEVTSGLSGLQGLKQLVSIGAVDVVGGSTEAIHLSIPGESRLRLGVGRLLSA